jgi:hypothetical protein
VSDLIQWSKADLRWTPDGYVLRAPIGIDERTACESLDDLETVIRDALAERQVVSISVTPADSAPGELEITTRQMIDSTEAVELREAVLRVFQYAVDETDRAAKDDEQAVKFVLAALRQPPA